jgi:hypothetical protein
LKDGSKVHAKEKEVADDFEGPSMVELEDAI